MTEDEQAQEKNINQKGSGVKGRFGKHAVVVISSGPYSTAVRKTIQTNILTPPVLVDHLPLIMIMNPPTTAPYNKHCPQHIHICRYIYIHTVM